MSPEFALSIVAELPGAAVFVVDVEYRYVVVGGEGIANAGMEASQFIGQSVLDMAPPHLRQQIRADFDAAFSGQTFVREHSAGERFFSTHGKPLYSAEGGPVKYALAVSYDVTERKLSELRLSVLEAASTLARQSSSEQDVIRDLAHLLRHKIGAAGVFFGNASAFVGEMSSISGQSCDGEDGVVDAVLVCPVIQSCVTHGATATAANSTTSLKHSRYGQDSVTTFEFAVICPFTDASGVHGVCAVFGQPHRRQWRAEEVLLLQELCVTGWQAIEKHRILSQLQTAIIKQK